MCQVGPIRGIWTWRAWRPPGWTDGGLSEGYGHDGTGVCLGDGQTEANGVPSQGGRGDTLLRRMLPYLTRRVEAGPTCHSWCGGFAHTASGDYLASRTRQSTRRHDPTQCGNRCSLAALPAWSVPSDVPALCKLATVYRVGRALSGEELFLCRSVGFFSLSGALAHAMLKLIRGYTVGWYRYQFNNNVSDRQILRNLPSSLVGM